MKVVIKYARRLGAAHRKKRARQRSKYIHAVPKVAEKPSWDHAEVVSSPPPSHSFDKAEEARLEHRDNLSKPASGDPPLYMECVGEDVSKEKSASPTPSVQVTTVEVAETTEGRPRELLYRSQFNELKERGRRPGDTGMPWRKVTRVAPDCTDYRAVYHKQAVAEVWVELFYIVKVATYAILAWLFVCGMIPPLK